MRIVFFTEYMSTPGGTVRVTCSIASALAEAGHDVRILTFSSVSTPYFPLSDKVKLDSLGIDKDVRGIRKLLIGIRKLRKWLIANSIEAVVGVDTILFLYIYPAAFGLSLSTVAWEQFNWKTSHRSRARIAARRLAAKLADAVVVLSDRDKHYWNSRCGKKTRLRTISNTDPYEGDRAPTPSYDSRPKVVLACGVLDRRKGFDLALQAWALIPEEIREGWKLRVLGEGPERSNLERLRKEYGIEHEVELPGSAVDMSREYLAAQVFILSSRYEGFGMVLLEALHFGLPCVAFDCDCGPAEILRKGGLLVPPEDIGGFACSMERLMGNDMERRKLASQATCDASRFLIERVGGHWQSLLGELEKGTRL